MPRLARSTLPQKVEPIVRALGINRIRLGIVLALAHEAGLTTTAIAEAISASKITVGEHLRELEVEGYVSASEPAGPDRRRSLITWTLNKDKPVDHLLQLVAEIR